MQQIDNTFDTLFVPLSPLHFLLDIETTGLSKTSDTIICIGVLYKKSPSQIKSIQWFCENNDDEYTVLKCFLAFCASYKAVYTYSGNSFDIPFIISRLAHYDLSDVVFKKLPFVDMKKVLSKIRPTRLLIERQLTYQRKTTVTGKELVTLYSLFESTGLLTYQTLILNHNTDELQSLLAMYEAYYVLHHLANYKPIDIQVQDSVMSIYLETDFVLSTACAITLLDMHLSWSKHTNLITLEILLHKGLFKKYLFPAKDYYFIKNQNQLIHKSVAKFIPKELRQKVTAKQCFIVFEYEKNDAFIPFILHQVSQLLTYT